MEIEDRFIKKNSFYSVIYLFKFLNKRRKNQLYLSCIVILLAALAEIFTIYFILPFINILFNSNSFDQNQIFNIFPPFKSIIENSSFFTIGILLIILVALSSTLRLLNLWININLSQKIAGDLSSKYFKHILYKNYMFHVRNNSSIIVADLNESIKGACTALDGLLQFISSITIVISIITGLLLINYKITIFSSIFFGLIYFLINFSSKNILFKNSQYSVKANALRLKFISEGLGAIREILLDNNQEFFVKNFEKVDRKLRSVVVQNAFIISAPRFLFEGLFLIILLVILVFVFQKSSSNDFISYIAVFAVAAQKILPLLQNIYRLVSNIRAKKYEVLQISNLLNQSIKLEKYRSESLKFEELFLKNICFNYSSEEKFIINDLNLKIKRGERIGIVGVTGSGKTTLIDLLIGLLIPKSGSIFINGKDINKKGNKSHLNKWRTSVANVPQNIFLTDSTFAENIAFGCPVEQIDMSRVRKCAKMANISKFIENKQLKYKSNIGEGGIKLSGGQKQRIAIARALYKNSELLIFDEATSALDNKTELNLVETLRGIDKQKTILIIAHRLSTLKYCDRVLELKDGKIIEKDDY